MDKNEEGYRNRGKRQGARQLNSRLGKSRMKLAGHTVDVDADKLAKNVDAEIKDTG